MLQMISASGLRTYARYLLLLAVPAFFFLSCDSPNSTTISGGGGTSTGTFNTTVTGLVQSASTLAYLDSAVVYVLHNTGQETGRTDATGRFTLKFTLDSSRVVKVIISKSGFKTDTLTVFATINSTNNVTNIKLSPVVTSSGTTSSGPASSVYMLSQSVASLGVLGSGSPTVGKVVFQAVDSLGRQLTLDRSVLVKFKLGSKPGGGEFLYPELAFTDTAGRAEVFLNTGTRAGVVQITAEITVGGKVIKSIPVNYAIHGGLPDQNHFGIAAAKLNFPGYNVFGLTNTITAYCGDKFGNPVRPNTSVYFTITGAYIQGSGQTNDLGEAAVNIVSAEPRPIDPDLGPGFAKVFAYTADENQATISNNMYVLFSGIPTVGIAPASFIIPNGGTQNFTYFVKDQNNNPLSSGTTITVTVTGESVNADGELNLTLPDTQSRAWTQFSFFVYDKVDTVDVSKPVSITLKTTGPNGNAQVTIRGTAR